MDPATRIDQLLESAMDAVRTAAERRDVLALPSLAKRVQKIQELKEKIQELDAALTQLEGETRPTPTIGPTASAATLSSSQAPASLSTSAFPRCMLISITQGMINQNLLTLTEHVQAGRVRTGQMLRIEAVPSGERFATDLMSEGNRLRERGAIARFYREARVKAGDTVALTEETPGDWKLRKWTLSEIPIGTPGITSEDKI